MADEAVDGYPDTDADQYSVADQATEGTDAQHTDEATDAYPDTDAQYTDEATDAYPDTDAQYADEASDAYPDTDAQYAADATEAYPDTDAQYADATEAYPDTDAQYADEVTDADAQSGEPAAAPEEPPAAPAPKPHWRPPDWSKLPVMHKPRLEMFENGRCARSMAIGHARCFVIGRNGQVADIVVPDESLSRAHAALINSSSASFLEDLDSAQGTWVDLEGRTLNVPQLGTRLVPGDEPVQLCENATFRFGSCNAVFRIVGLQHETVRRWEPPRWSQPPGAPCHLEVRSNAYSNPYLAHLADEEGGDADELFRLTSACTVLGRSAGVCDVVLKDASISRQHAALLHADGATYVQDLGSASGSFVDGRRIPPNTPEKLADGTVLKLGECKSTYTYRMTAGQSVKRRR